MLIKECGWVPLGGLCRGIREDLAHNKRLSGQLKESVVRLHVLEAY